MTPHVQAALFALAVGCLFAAGLIAVFDGIRRDIDRATTLPDPTADANTARIEHINNVIDLPRRGTTTWEKAL